MKMTKRILSFLLCALMICSPLMGLDVDWSIFDIKANAEDIKIGGITQQRVVGTDGSYEELYKTYADRFFMTDTDGNTVGKGGNEVNGPTDFVIPGLSEADNYIPQGMTYWAAKEWILISAYDAGETKNSVIYAIDASSRDFVALFNIYDQNGDVNTSHGGGIAATEHNFYYADSDSKISYWPIEEMDVTEGTAKSVYIYDSIDCAGELNNAKTSYCCYDDGVLWAGNFHWYNDSDYAQYAYGTSDDDGYRSMLVGYELEGSNSAEEWAYLKGKYNKQITITSSGTNSTINDATCTWNASYYDGHGNITVKGSITAPTAYVGEFCYNFATFTLTEGMDYTIEFDSSNKSSDLYMFAPTGKHCNVKQSSQTTITDNGDGTYHYAMKFTAGLKPTGADSSWPTTQSTDGSFTATYTLRFDQDAIQAGEARDFTISDIRISEANVNMIHPKNGYLDTSKTNKNTTYTVTQNNDGSLKLSGTNTDSSVYSYTAQFADFALVEGEQYTVSFISDNAYTNTYIFAPNSKHQSFFGTYTKQLDDGRYYYEATFTAGIKHSNMDHTWPDTQSTDGSYTGIYTMRIDIHNNAAVSSYTVDEITVKKADESRITDTEIGMAGNPTYCIAFNNDIDRIQYAMVDKGKIYISRSWSRTATGNHLRALAIGDFDINAPGKLTLTINGKSRNCHYVDTSDVTTFGGNKDSSGVNSMFYMGEALCIMNDKLYMFGEGAAWKYNGAGDLCDEPIDVIWEIDQYAIVGENKPIEEVKASHYEKVTDLTTLSEDDEYIIVNESQLTDPVTQNKILYALDSFGGYGNKKLPKKDDLTSESTGGSIGVIGYEIADYSLSDDGSILYISEEVDSNKSIRWKMEISTSTANTATVAFKNSDMYYATNPYLAINNEVIAMSSSKVTFDITNFGNRAEDFIVNRNSTSNYLWCNTEISKTVNGASCMDIYNDYYKNHGITDYTPNFDGLAEAEGTFHTDALAASGGLLETGKYGSIADYQYGYFNIYRRVPDEYSSTYQSRVYTDMNAELQADGTYNIDIDSYALSNIQYQTLEEDRPTDFIFVLDTSSSMWGTSDCTGYNRFDGSSDNVLEVKSMIPEDDTAVDHDNDEGKYGYHKTNGKNIYYQAADGEFYQLYAGFYNEHCNVPWWVSDVTQNYWIYYKNTTNGLYYILNNDNSIKIADLTEASLISYIESNSNYTSQSTQSDNSDRRKTKLLGEHYELTTVTRLQVMQNAVNQLTYKIASEVDRTGLDHRIALVQYGNNYNSGTDAYANTGMYATTGTSMYQYPGSITTETYQNAFFAKDRFATVRSYVNGINTSWSDCDTFVEYGMDMAANIVQNSGTNYTASGDRSACIIMITDGVPGYGSNDPTTANTSANEAIRISHIAKEAGAYVYSVQMGSNSIEGFNMDRYMDYISSEYIDATSMTDSGDRNIKDVEYRIDVPTGDDFNLVTLVDAMFDSVTSNSRNAMVKLNAESVLREQLTDAFDITNATATVYEVPALLDGLGRFVFDYDSAVESADATATINTSDNTVTVTGFDYSSKYVYSGGGYKLRLSLTGVLANEDSELVNTSINNTDTTAIYETEALMNSGDAFKYFPTENFTIPEYNYILDFAKPMLDTDINGTLCSVSSTLSKQSTYSTTYKSENAKLTFTNNNQDMIYELSSANTFDENKNKAYCLIQRDDGTYDWFRINILPATNVLFEQNVFGTSSALTGTTWSTVTDGSAASYQDISTFNDVYGYDTNYLGNSDKYSDGSALTASVDSSNKRSQITTYTFTGTGFDLYGQCGSNTGIMIVSVKDSEGNGVKATVVDTYYNDSTYGTLNQVPVASATDLDYGTYTVQVAAVYLSQAGALGGVQTQSVAGFDDVTAYSAPVSGAQWLYESLEELGFEDVFEAEELDVVWFDDESVFNGGYGADTYSDGTSTASLSSSNGTLVNIIDSIRVYNPADPDLYPDEYYLESEQNAQYFNIMDNLVNGGTVTGNGNVAYVYSEDGDNTEVTFASYESKGSKEEIYLTNNTNAITFNVNNISSDSKIMISLRAAAGSPKAKIGEAEFSVNSSTEMYYDITNYIALDSDTGVGTVTVQNSGEGLLAIGNVKITGMATVASTFSFMMTARMMSAAAEEVEPNSSEAEIIAPADSSLLPTPVTPEVTPDTETQDDSSSDDNSVENQIIAFFNKVAEFMKKLFETIMSLFGY